MSYPPAFDPSLVEESPVLVCNDPDCGDTTTIHFASPGDRCNAFPVCTGKYRPATAAERAEILAGHAEDACEP